MQLEARKYLYDIQQAAALLIQFTAGKNFEEFSADHMLRSAVERQFEIIGEALTQLAVPVELEIPEVDEDSNTSVHVTPGAGRRT